VSIQEMKAIDARYWPKAPAEASQGRREAVPHLCSRCLTRLERHTGDGIMETYWCPGCATASAKLADACFCGVGRAGGVLRCTWMPSEDGGPGEIAVVEPEAPIDALPASGAAERRPYRDSTPLLSPLSGWRRAAFT